MIGISLKKQSGALTLAVEGESAVTLLGAVRAVQQRSRMHPTETAFGGTVFFALTESPRFSTRAIPCVGSINPTRTARRTDRNREKGEREKKGKKEREKEEWKNHQPSEARSALGDGTVTTR